MIKTNLLHLKFLKIFLFFLLAFVQLLHAGTSKSFDFGMYLFQHQQYFRAISEFERFIFFNKKNKKVLDAKFFMGLSYYKAQLYYKSIETFEKIEKSNKFQIPSLFFMGDSAYHIQQYNRAFSYYQKIYDKTKSSKVQQEALFRSTWPVLKQHKFNQVLSIYEKLDTQIVSDLPYLKTSVKKLANFKGLSPILSGTMSAIIPGAGQVYDKRIGDGIVAFLTVGLLTTSSYFLWTDYKYKEIAIAISLTDIFFYLGNIYSAFSSAHKYNKLFYQKNIDMLYNNYWNEYEYQ